MDTAPTPTSPPSPRPAMIRTCPYCGERYTVGYEPTDDLPLPPALVRLSPCRCRGNREVRHAATPPPTCYIEGVRP